MNEQEHFDVAVVGSGAGGGVIAGELAQRGRSVVLLEAGPHRTAADFTRWEAEATHNIWWPFRQALIDGGAGGAIGIIAGRCVGGTTTINTKVALRAHERDFAKWEGAGGLEFGPDDLAPTTTASRARSACASAATGSAASTPWSRASAPSAPSSSPSTPTPTTTA